MHNENINAPILSCVRFLDENAPKTHFFDFLYDNYNSMYMIVCENTIFEFTKKKKTMHNF